MPHRRDQDNFDEIRRIQQQLRDCGADPRWFVPKKFGIPVIEDKAASPYFLAAAVVAVVFLAFGVA